MKLSLMIVQGKTEGKVIPITVPQFVVGRDPQCHLRPASSAISKKHCVLLVRDGKAYIRDLDSTNGTIVNDEPVKGERELKNKDCLKVGPLSFIVQIEASRPARKAASAFQDATGEIDDDSVADLLLELEDEDMGNEAPASNSTEVEILLPEPEKPEVKKPVQPNKSDSINTQNAAQAALAKYARRRPQ